MKLEFVLKSGYKFYLENLEDEQTALDAVAMFRSGKYQQLHISTLTEIITVELA